MTATAPVGYMALPFDPQRGDKERLTLILDTFCSNPSWMTLPAPADVMRMVAARILTNPENDIREVWRGGEFVGLLLLTNITPGVDALCHFVFFDRSLVGKRQLILNWMDDCFADYNLQRISLEVPEFIGTLVGFARRKLGFKYEGETRSTDVKHNDAVHIAKQGSRKERAHYHNDHWHDIVRLRVLREERMGRG